MARRAGGPPLTLTPGRDCRLDDEVLPAALGTLALLGPDEGADRTVDLTDEGNV